MTITELIMIILLILVLILQVSLLITKDGTIVDITEEQAIDKLHETGWMQRHDKEMTERPTGEWIEVKHRLNLLIGVLYSNQLISKSDLYYMDDSIKELMKEEKNGKDSQI